MRRLIPALLAIPSLLAAQESFDRAMIARIRDEGLNHSHAYAMLDTIATVIGPRLTGSPAFMRAAEYAKGRLESFGLSDVHMESWPFGRGWQLDKFTLEMTAPRYTPLIGYPDAWSPSTNGDVVGTPLLIAGISADSLEKMRGRLKGAIVLAQPLMTNFIREDRVNPTAPNAPADVYTPAPPIGGGRGGRGGGRGPTEAQRIAAILHDAGVGVVLKPSRGIHGTLFVQTRDAGASGVPTVVVAAEHYNNIIRLLANHVAPTLRVNVHGQYFTRDTSGYNVIAELPGTDPRLKDEVVMIGGHLDSWHAATGAMDNADGAATVMEAMRILTAVGARPRRTIRVALWGGEEEGLFGSRAWVERHLAGDANAGARDKMSVYFNIDPGYGLVYGFYTEGNAAAKQIFDAWLEPFKDLGARKNVVAGIGNTDHLSFIAQGIPGFNPVQEFADYDVRIHHTDMDTIDRMKPDDIKEAAIVFAAFAYNAAMRDEKIPRAPR
ncbi:MAG TPA: M20/M25/M40 family metallo-hydrolase [Gemmatimonadaceae bacterium]|nr:M20/M25/M40 family metallo-hydrolase [Gemmatimonadaceae bacterium]